MRPGSVPRSVAPAS
uniref:Uncharacterized protein n=1 Tax=Anguilla anguilla TaxID=7936 RepID=A0A0E9TW60_ANGAN